MMICRVVGTCVATIKDESLHGMKLLLLAPEEQEEGVWELAFVAVDGVGAGFGELVLVVRGSSARRHPLVDESVVDAVIVGIIDTIERPSDGRERPSVRSRSGPRSKGEA